MGTVIRTGKGFDNKGTTLVELVVAVALMTVIMSTLLPVLSSARKTWDTSQNNAETLQNGRILMDHLHSKLSQVASIEAVSNANVTQGHIEFKDNEDDTYRYDISGSNYVEYGQVGSLIDLAGPVNQLNSPVTMAMIS